MSDNVIDVKPEQNGTQAIVPQRTAMATTDHSPEGLLALAIDRGITVEGIEKLMTLAREVRAERAKADFVKAMASFQAACPVVEKTRTVMNKDGKTLRYFYAAIEDIKKVIAPHMDENGLSFSFDTAVADGIMTVICKVQHESGHSEVSTFGVPLGDSQYMSSAQNFAASVTYAKRYALCNALGIVVGDEDNDGQKPEKPTRTETNHTDPKTGGTMQHPPTTKPPHQCQTAEELTAAWRAVPGDMRRDSGPSFQTRANELNLEWDNKVGYQQKSAAEPIETKTAAQPTKEAEHPLKKVWHDNMETTTIDEFTLNGIVIEEFRKINTGPTLSVATNVIWPQIIIPKAKAAGFGWDGRSKKFVKK